MVRSISNLSWGTRAEKVEKTPASSGRLRASSWKRSTTFWSVSVPLPDRSSIISSKPPVALRPRIAGGCETITMASRTFDSTLFAWTVPARPTARSSGVVRSFQPCSGMKTTPQLL